MESGPWGSPGGEGSRSLGSEGAPTGAEEGLQGL